MLRVAPVLEKTRRAKPGKQKGASKVHSANVVELEDVTHHRAVEQLLRQQRRKGTVEDWLPGYIAELEAVRKRRDKGVTVP